MSETKAESSPQLPFPETRRVDPWIRTLADLFHDEMGELHFPEVDAKRLNALVERVDEHALAVARARAALEAADRALNESHAELSRAARRAHGYATVFAQDREDLAARLAELRPTAPKKRKATGKRKAKANPKREDRTETAAPARSKAAPAAA